LRLLHADARGYFTVGIKCPASTSTNLCRGTARVTANTRTIASRAFSIRANRVVNVRMRLNAAGRAMLRRHRSLRVGVRVRSRTTAGALRSKTQRLTLRRPG
jgi:hypothetical protein